MRPRCPTGQVVAVHHPTQPVPQARNLTSIGVLVSRRRQRPERPLGGEEVANHLDGLDGPLAGISPPSDLVEVVADARDPPGALALDLG